jgi:hypothetical protein
MKKKQPKSKLVKTLATQLEFEFNKSMPLSVRPDGSIVYKDFFIKSKKSGNWAVYNINSKDEVGEYFLKTCAILAAKAYHHSNIDRFLEIKRLDNCYWSNRCDTLVFRNNLNKVKDFDRYLILLNRLEESEVQASYYKDEISKLFNRNFV